MHYAVRYPNWLLFSSSVVAINIVSWGRFLPQNKSERPEEGDGDLSAMAKQNGSIRSGRHYSIVFNAQPLFAVIPITELSWTTRTTMMAMMIMILRSPTQTFDTRQEETASLKQQNTDYYTEVHQHGKKNME